MYSILGLIVLNIGDRLMDMSQLQQKEQKDFTLEDWHKYLEWAMHWRDETPEDIIGAAPRVWRPEHADTVFLSLEYEDYDDYFNCYREVFTENWVYFLVNDYVEGVGEIWKMWWVRRNPAEYDEIGFYEE